MLHYSKLIESHINVPRSSRVADILQNRFSYKCRKFHRKILVLESLFNKVNYKNTRTTTPIVAASVYRRLKQITLGVHPAPILPFGLKFALRMFVDI